VSTVLYVVRYAVAEGAASRVMEVYPRHLAYLTDAARDGQIVSIGPLLPAPESGSMAVFRSREAAEAFPVGDPFVLEGLAVPSDVQEWQALEFPPESSG
jgi:uncharacterized protein YciI